MKGKINILLFLLFLFPALVEAKIPEAEEVRIEIHGMKRNAVQKRVMAENNMANGEIQLETLYDVLREDHLPKLCAQLLQRLNVRLRPGQIRLLILAGEERHRISQRRHYLRGQLAQSTKGTDLGSSRKQSFLSVARTNRTGQLHMVSGSDIVLED